MRKDKSYDDSNVKNLSRSRKKIIPSLTQKFGKDRKTVDQVGPIRMAQPIKKTFVTPIASRKVDPQHTHGTISQLAEKDKEK